MYLGILSNDLTTLQNKIDVYRKFAPVSESIDSQFESISLKIPYTVNHTVVLISEQTDREKSVLCEMFSFNVKLSLLRILLNRIHTSSIKLSTCEQQTTADIECLVHSPTYRKTDHSTYTFSQILTVWYMPSRRTIPFRNENIQKTRK